MRQPTTSTATATASASGQGSLLDRYWVGGAAFLRRYSLVLSEAWYDGIYLTAWRRFALWTPLALLLLGLAEGITHATVAFRFTNGASVVEFGLVPFGTQPLFKTDSMQLLVGFTQGQAVAFTELLPLMVLVALAGALGANLGMVLVLGYALGDFLIAGPQIHFLPYGAQGNPLAAFAYQRVPQLVSYALFLLLAVTPTLTAKYLSAPIQRLQGDQRLLWLLRGGAMLLLQGAAVYTWTQAAPLLVRIFWGWINANPPLTAEYNLQVDGYWLVYAAALAAGLRAVLSYLAYGRADVAARVRALANALASAETHQAISRKIPGPIRVLLTAGALTLLLSGFIGGLVEAGIILAFLVVLLLARSLWLPRWDLWNTWARLVSRVPVVVRLVVVFLAGNYVGNAIVALWFQSPPWLDSVLQWYAQFNRSGSATFLPVLLSTCLGILIAVALLPSVDEADDESSAAASATQPA